VDTDN